MINVVIAEDDPWQLRFLADLVRKLRPQWPVVAEVADIGGLTEAVATLSPRLCILDVRYGASTSFDVVEQLGADCGVIFVTGDPAYAVQAFDCAAIDFVTKPIRPERLERALLRAESLLSRAPIDSCALSDALPGALPGALPAALPAAFGARNAAARPRWVRMLRGADLVCVPLSEVRYFQAQRKHTRVVVGEFDGLLRMGFGATQAMLDAAEFWQIHRGTLVNIAHLQVARRDELGRVTLSLTSRRETIIVARPYEQLFRDGIA